MIYLTDEDECDGGTHDCEQICVNTPGSYSCTCTPGYLANMDGKTCDGRFDGDIKIGHEFHYI